MPARLSSATSSRLGLLRAALRALSLGDDGPDRVRLEASLQVLDPMLSGDVLGPPAWVERTGLPAPAWLGRALQAQQSQLEATPDLPDEGLVHATSLDPGLGERLLRERAFRGFLERNKLFDVSRVSRPVDEEGHDWWTWDALLPDGRWGRLRVRGQVTATATEAWWSLDIDTLAARVGATPVSVRRTLVGPAYRDPSGVVCGLWATVEAPGSEPLRRVAIERMSAEDVEADGAQVRPFAAPVAAPGAA